MTTGEAIYLVMTLCAFGAFMATLAYVDHQLRNGRRPVQQPIAGAPVQRSHAR